MMDFILDSFKFCFIRISELFVLTILPFFLMSLYTFGTRNMVHPTLYVCKHSTNVKTMVLESSFLSDGNENITIVDSPLFGDILWLRKYDHMLELYAGGLIRPHQAVNHIVGEMFMSRKSDLTRMYRDKKRRMKGTIVESDKFYPLTYDLNNKGDLDEFLFLYTQHRNDNNKRRKKIRKFENRCDPKNNKDENQVCTPSKGEQGISFDEITWMLKPSRSSGGTGIKIMTPSELEEFVKVLELKTKQNKDNDNDFYSISDHLSFEKDLDIEQLDGGLYILQQYIHNPLLAHGKKFSVRVYWLIASLQPLRVMLYKQGRTTSASLNYDYTANKETFSKKTMHLTNRIQQEKGNHEKATQWNFTVLEEYLVDEQIVQPGWLDTDFFPAVNRMLEFTCRVFIEKINNSYSKYNIYTQYEHLFFGPGDGSTNNPSLDENSIDYGYFNSVGNNFGLYAMDLLLDENAKVYLTEVQKGPGMKLTNPVKRKILQGMFEEMIDIIFEIQTADVNNVQLRDVTKMNNFMWVVNGANNQ